MGAETGAHTGADKAWCCFSSWAGSVVGKAPTHTAINTVLLQRAPGSPCWSHNPREAPWVTVNEPRAQPGRGIPQTPHPRVAKAGLGAAEPSRVPRLSQAAAQRPNAGRYRPSPGTRPAPAPLTARPALTVMLQWMRTGPGGGPREAEPPALAPAPGTNSQLISSGQALPIRNRSWPR